MKTLALICCLFPLTLFAQDINTTWDGQARKYVKYVPAIYDGSTPVPVVFSLHGLGDNMNNFKNVGFHQIADTANFIVITPEALVDGLTGSTAWNSGAGVGQFALNANVDDIGFLNNILDTLVANYNIDLTRIYSTGFSMGGFMSHRLACEWNGRIAAIASAAGTIGNVVTCNPGRAVPVCHFHGTADATISYDANTWGMNAQEVVDFWVANNTCVANVDSTQLPDIANDGYTVTHHDYQSCTDNANVELFKVYGADHTWLFTPASDIHYTKEMWWFFLKHQHPNPGQVGIADESFSLDLNVAPNPANQNIGLNVEVNLPMEVQVQLINMEGKKVLTSSHKLNSGQNQIELSVRDFSNGLYFLEVTGASTQSSRRVLIQH